MYRKALHNKLNRTGRGLDLQQSRLCSSGELILTATAAGEFPEDKGKAPTDAHGRTLKGKCCRFIGYSLLRGRGLRPIASAYDAPQTVSLFAGNVKPLSSWILSL